jgi:hypothetical protein
MIQYNHKRNVKIIDNFPEIGGMEKSYIQPRGGETVALELPHLKRK